jgi:hypothetical protein
LNTTCRTPPRGVSAGLFTTFVTGVRVRAFVLSQLDIAMRVSKTGAREHTFEPSILQLFLQTRLSSLRNYCDKLTQLSTILSTHTDTTTKPGNLITCRTPPRGVSAGLFTTFVTGVGFVLSCCPNASVRDRSKGAYIRTK